MHIARLLRKPNHQMTSCALPLIAGFMSDTPLSMATFDVLPPGAIPAATLVIMRPAADGTDDEILMVKRAATMVFAAGAVVFPGGRVDPDDHLVAAAHGLDDDQGEGAARVAAVRETLEETGLAVGWDGMTDADVAAVRAELLAGTLLSDILAVRALRLNLDVLVPFARWCPNFKEARTFDTRFYAVRAPDHGHELTVEEAEHSHIFWSSAAATLANADRGEISIIFPTRRNLEKLAHCGDFAAFADHAAAYAVRLVTPWIEDRDGMPHLCIADDLGYPVTSEPLGNVRRG